VKGSTGLERDLLGWAASILGRSAADLSVTPLAGGGSDRVFYRLTWGEKAEARSVILIHYGKERQENAYYAALGSYLRECGAPVPAFYGHDPQRGGMVMEDLGDTDLWSLRTAPVKERLRLYEKTLDAVALLHRLPLEGFPWDRVPLMAGFDAALYRWERDYFRENLMERACGLHLDPGEDRLLEASLHDLAVRLEAVPQTLVHRDFQSRNILVRNGEPYLIDFQGMRQGNPFYDLASLLCDPYVDWTDKDRNYLLDYAAQQLTLASGGDFFRRCFWEAATQRLLQALGAYGYLGLIKGRTGFLEHIPAGLARLVEAAERVEGLTVLENLARRCLRAVEDAGARFPLTPAPSGR
jgi:aminoglycoside/choline kinase family phosphotransferase